MNDNDNLEEVFHSPEPPIVSTIIILQSIPGTYLRGGVQGLKAWEHDF